MAVDVVSEVEIDRPRAEVAAYAADPDAATSWYENLEAVAWQTPRPLAVGSRVAFVARFLGRRLAYTYEVREHVPGERFVMRTARGPVPDGDHLHLDRHAVRWHPDGAAQPRRAGRSGPACGATGGPGGARANRKDLARLRSILEAARPAPGRQGTGPPHRH